MALATPVSLELWEKTLPRSKMAYPSSFADKIKYCFWRVYTPFHPTVRDFCLAVGIVKHSGRQNFFVGYVAPGQSLDDVVSHLISRGYGNHFIAWKDDGELVSLRRVIDFKMQYHIRIFQDGEIRGHYEYTPECHPILHFKAVDEQECKEEFLKALDDKVVLEK